MKNGTKLSILVFVASTLFPGCGKDGPSSPADDTTGRQASIELSPKPCIAKFTGAYTILDVFGDEEFSVRAGDSFIVKSSSGFFHPQLYFLTDKGAYEFEVKSDSEGKYPFASDCADGGTETHLAAFRNTTVYSDSALTRPLCTLSRGSTAPAGASNGYYLVGDFFSQVYHVELGGFASQCQDADGGYVEAAEVDLFGATTYLVPINSYESPAE